ncbi:MAG: TRAP transporter small permease [Deltaproteobacteria bacterium]|nr:TRAP transporter small permease [Deltaproteobacteria bacterium]
MSSSTKAADKIAARFDLVIDRILTAFMVIAGVLCILMMLGISVEVVTRYFWNIPILGMLEASEMAMLYIAFLSAAWVLKKEAHVNMDLINSYLPPRALAILNVLLSLVGAAIAFVLLWYGAKVTIGVFLDGTNMPGNMDINKGYQLMIIPLGSLLLFIQFLRRACGFWKNAQSGNA